MKSLGLLFLVCLPVASVARSAASSVSGAASLRVRHHHLLKTPRGGGGTTTTSSSGNNSKIDMDSIGSFVSDVSNRFVKDVVPILKRESKNAATILVKDVLPVLKRESQNAANFCKEFLEQQKENAAKRRDQYRGDFGKTASTLADPLRAAKLTLAALFIAEALQYVDGQGFGFDDLSDLAFVAADNVFFQAESFWKVGRQPGGLLQGLTWTTRESLFAGIQRQVYPKYQWAIGAALGFVVSPALWSLGWQALGTLAVVYVVAEGHHIAKRTSTEYFTFLKETQNPLIFYIDDILEDVRDFVEAVKIDPKGTLFTVRNKIDERIDVDLEFPKELKRGLLFGSFVGVLTGM